MLCSGEGGLHDFSGSLSTNEFDVFVESASLAYDQYQDEVIVSGAEGHSFVFNIGAKSFHKIPSAYRVMKGSTRYATIVHDGERSVADLNTEMHVLYRNVMVQSRPMVLSALFSHIDRAILYVDTMLSLEGQYLCLSVFASDNLSDWKCVISSQKKNTVLSHIRTNRAARSYRYYIVLVNGTVSTDTDISSLVVDYTEVTRRLG
jgi:hypothetical protein